MRSLLDINVLLALLDADHVHHDLARDWLIGNAGDGWASCPITENGFVRIISQPAYPGSISTVAAMELLDSARVPPTHEFWPDDVSLLRAVDPAYVLGPKQVTDLYLFALAVHHAGRFVTFDGRVRIDAVPRATSKHLVVLGHAH